MTHPIITLNDGNTMPQIGLGVWRVEDGDEAAESVSSAIQAGYRLIDTAAVYQNEAGVGQGIRNSGVDRSELFITTKLWNSDQGTDKVRPALEASLERLGLDYVDLYLIHWPVPKLDLFVETWKEFEALQHDGLVRSIGVSNFRIEDLERLAKESSITPAVNQIEVHPYFQQKELRAYAAEHNISIESWSPLGGSTGNVLDDNTLQEIAQKHNKSVAQVVLRWHIQTDLIVIPKSVNESRIIENYSIFDFELTQEDMAMIEALDAGNRVGPDPSTMNSH